MKNYAALGVSPALLLSSPNIATNNIGSYVIGYRSLHISYPNIADQAAAKKLKCDPGGDIFIHGLPNGYGWIGKAHIARDWTLGCIAVTDQEIEEIWRLTPNGTAVEIRP